jgi:hypothetical protein
MRVVLAGVMVVVAGAVIWLGAQRFLVSIALLPGSQAIDMAAVGRPITPEGNRRATAALNLALQIMEHPRIYHELGAVKSGFGRQPLTSSAVGGHFLDAATEALRRSAGLSPVVPTTWLVLAQVRYEMGEFDEAAAALDWSMRTGHYVKEHAVTRAAIGLGLWPRLQEETRTRLVESIVTALDNRAVRSGIVAWAVQLDLDVELAQRLRRRGADGPAQAAAFLADVAAHRAERRAQEAAAEENARMRQLVAATSMIVTASLPAVGEAMTIADYLASARGEPLAMDRASVETYLVGVLDGLVMLGTVNREDEAAVFCMPDPERVTVDLPAMRTALDAMLADLQEEMPGFEAFARTRTLGLAVLQLLAAQFPCDDSAAALP